MSVKKQTDFLLFHRNRRCSADMKFDLINSSNQLREQLKQKKGGVNCYYTHNCTIIYLFQSMHAETKVTYEFHR